MKNRKNNGPVGEAGESSVRRGREKINFRTVKALLRKEFEEKRSVFKTGQFDIVGFILRIVLIGAMIALFVVFFGRFTGVYMAVKTDGRTDIFSRATELLTIFYTAIIIGMVVSGVNRLGAELFNSDDMKIYSALPINEKTLFIAKLISIYKSQFAIALVTVFTVNITFAIKVPVTFAFWAFTLVICFLLPLMAIAIASALILPYQVIKRFLRERYILMFIVVTALLGVAFWLYSMILGGVKQMMLGDAIRYFFNEKVMATIGNVCAWLYPARWYANIMTGSDPIFSWFWLLGVAAVCILFSLLIIKSILRRALQARNEGVSSSILRSTRLTRKCGKFATLLRKEFLLIFRTPSYMFSYLSVALIMPLMVYSCMELGASIVQNLVGLNIYLEIALFLTILFGALTNIFCATNISRDGIMFYSVKALPINYKDIFFSKIVLCLIVNVLSQTVSAIILGITGYIGAWDAIFVFVVGMLFSFVNIAVATRYDFNHVKFSTEEDGEIKESSNTVSAIIVMGIVLSFAVGGLVFVLKALSQLRGFAYGPLTYVLAGGFAVIAAALSAFYLLFRLDRKYYEFSGGEL